MSESEGVKEIEIRIGGGKSSQEHQRFLKQKGISPENFTATPTKTELMQTREEIEKRLKGFEEIGPEEIDALPKNSFVSYISFDVNKNRELYRPGGFVRKVHADYVVLMGKGSAIFSVQRKVWQDPKTKEALVYTTRFFQRVPGAKVEMSGGGGEAEAKEEVEKKVVSALLQKQREILEAKEREIEEMRKRLEMLEARDPRGLPNIRNIDIDKRD